MKHLGRSILLAMALVLSCAAHAQGQLAFAAKTVNVRAGPGQDYPIVAVLPPGFQLAVQGCLPDYVWCDVIAGGSRGWVYAGNINYAYQNSYVPVLDYGPVIGIGVLAFALNDYWGHHYRNRPWYADRHRWIDRHPSPPHRRFDGPRSRPDLVHPGQPHFRGDRPRGPDAIHPGQPHFRGERGRGPDAIQPRHPHAGDRPRGPRANPSGAAIPGAQPPVRQPGTARSTPPQQGAVPQAQQQGPPQGGGSGWRPSDARRQGRVQDQ
jgi:uncharacterized protein YraI